MKESNAGLKIWVWLLVKETDTDKNRKTCKLKYPWKVNGLEESVTFDDIQMCFWSVVWLLIIGKVYDIVIVFRGFLPPTVC